MKLRELFEQALALPTAARDAFLDAHCHDPSQRAELERMLAADAAEGGLLDAGDAAAIAGRIGDAELAPSLPPGSRIGPFELIEVLGEGGSSTVFRAFREVDGVRQEVALKLLRRGLYAPDAQRQFRREQRALAQLKHPGIARMIEGGITDSGLAYIALELVDGISITRYADEHGLGLGARLTLFEQVCNAVQAAHQALIVHRDLKPSNVLVTADGEVKLLDFGIAKLLDDDEQTQTLHAALTPAYAAPEQYAGEAATTATDVYALGVLLGELVTGQRLNDGRGTTPSERFRTADAPPPPHIDRRQLRGDLDNIVMKAIDAEPDRRYASAGAMAEDIARMRSGQPVMAHPPSRAYRMRKFVARHRGGVAVTALFLIAIIAALGTALWQADVARQQATRALNEAHRANAVRDFVEHLFEPLRYGATTGHQPSLAELLDTSVTRLQNDRTLPPGSRVDLLAMFSRIDENIGEPEKSRQLAEAAVALAGRALAPDDINSIRALTARGYIAARTEDYATALHDLDHAYRLMRRRDIHGEPLIDLLGPLAAVQDRMGHGERALQLSREALAERIATWGKDDPRVGVGYNDIASALEGLGRYEEAIPAWKRTYEFTLAHAGEHNTQTALALGGLASANYRAGHWPAAHEQFERVMEMYRESGRKPQLTVVYAAEKSCFLEGLMAHREHAEHRCREAAGMAREGFGEQSDIYGDAIEATGIGLFETGSPDTARRDLERARAIYADVPTNDLRFGRVDSYLAAIALLDNDPARARELLLPAMPKLHARDTTPRLLAEARLLLACNAAPAADCPHGLRAELAAGLKDAGTGSNPRLLEAWVALARVDLRAGHADEALHYLQSGIEHARANLDEAHPRMLEAQLWLATTQARLGQCDAAKTLAGNVDAALHAHGAAHPPLLATAQAAWGAVGSGCRNRPPAPGEPTTTASSR